MLSQNVLFYHCPAQYQINCQNWNKQCESCMAFDETQKEFLYKPINQSLKHPLFLEQKEERKQRRRQQLKENQQSQIVRNSKRGRKVEKQIIKHLKKEEAVDCRSAALSGALFQDGDASVVINNMEYSAEIKSRTNTNLFGPSKKEWQKAISQNVDLFITHSEEYGSFISMPLDIFLQIIQGENKE